MIRLIAYTFASIGFQIFASVLVIWWAPLFARQGEFSDRGATYQGPVLPWWLAWIDTFDAHLDTGLQMGLYDKQPWIARSPYLRRVAWLYRNRCYGFSYWALGVEFDPDKWCIEQFAEDATRVSFCASRISDTMVFNIYYIHRGIYKLGWKAWNMLDRAKLAAGHPHPWQDQPWGPEWRIPFTFSINPFGRKR